MTNVADRDGKEILALQATVKDLKRHLAQSDSKLKTSQKRESLLVSPTKSRAHTASASFDDLVDTADANSPSAKHKSLSEALSRSSVEIDDLKLLVRTARAKRAQKRASGSGAQVTSLFCASGAAGSSGRVRERSECASEASARTKRVRERSERKKELAAAAATPSDLL
jgi:hypothetical protein